MRVGHEMPLLVGEEGVVVAEIKNKRFQLQTMQKHALNAKTRLQELVVMLTSVC